MKETLHFHYQSIENLVRLLCNVQYEKTHSSREIAIYYERLDKEPDSFFYNMIVELYPSGVTVGEKEINQFVKWIENFLEKDEEVKDIKVRYDMVDYDSYVYFDIDKKVYECKFASHQKTIKNICVDYFKGFKEDELSEEQVRKFILDHFKIKSSFSTIERIANDSRYIYECIIFENIDREERIKRGLTE